MIDEESKLEESVDDFIARQGWKIQKHEGGEIVLQGCPLCGKSSKKRTDRNFYINATTGQYCTYCCMEKGNLITLKKHLGLIELERPFGKGDPMVDRLTQRLKQSRGSSWEGHSLPPSESVQFFEKRLEAVGDAMGYLREERCLEEKTIKHFRLGLARRGYCKACEGQVLVSKEACHVCKGYVSNVYEAIAIPVFVGKQLVNYKFRSYEGQKRFEKWKGAPNLLFNLDSLENHYESVMICEAELDVMTLWQLGYEVAIGTGTAGRNLDDDARERLARFDEVLIAYDSDRAGEDGAEKLAGQLGRYRCGRVKFPDKDVNDCLRNGRSVEEIKTYIEGAQAYQHSSVKHIGDFEAELWELKKGDSEKVLGRQSMWHGVNNLIAGWRAGEVTVVTGDTGSGKTTWTTACAWDQSKGDPGDSRDGVGTLIASFEMPSRDTARKLVSMEAGKSFVDMDNVDLHNAMSNLRSRNIFFVDHYGEIPLDDLRDAIEYGVRRYGLWYVVVDHLHFMLEGSPEKERYMIDKTMRAIKSWALKLQVHIVLVVHPSKLRTDIEGVPLKVELNDLKGSSEIKKVADNVLRVWVPRDLDRSNNHVPYSEITTLKARSDFAKEGSVQLEFDRNSLRYEYTEGTPTQNPTTLQAGPQAVADAIQQAAQAAAASEPEPEPEPSQQAFKLYTGSPSDRQPAGEGS